MLLLPLIATPALADEPPALAWFHPGDGGCAVAKVAGGKTETEVLIPVPCPAVASLSVAANGAWAVSFASKPNGRAWEVEAGKPLRELPVPPSGAAVLYDAEGRLVAVTVLAPIGAASATSTMKATARRYQLEGETWKNVAEGEVSGLGNGRGWLMLDLVPSAARQAFTQTQPLVPTGSGWAVRLATPADAVSDPRIGEPVVLARDGIPWLSGAGLDVGPAFVLHLPLQRKCATGWCELVGPGAPFTWDLRESWLVSNVAGTAGLWSVETGASAWSGPGLAAFWPQPPKE